MRFPTFRHKKKRRITPSQTKELLHNRIPTPSQKRRRGLEEKRVDLLARGGAGKADLLALDKDLLVVTIVADEEVLLEGGLDGIMVVDIDRGVVGRGVDQDGIKLLADLKVSDGVLQAHDAGTTNSGEVEELSNDQGRLHVEGDGGGAGGAEGLEDRRGVTTGDICTETDLDLLVEHLADVGDARLEVEVGVGAVGDTRLLLLDEIELLILHVDTVGHDGAVVQKAVVGIDGGVVDGLGEERHGEANLVHVLAEMRLDRQLVLLGQLAQLGQEVRSAGDGKARGDDGGDKRLVLNLGVNILDVLDKGTGITDRGLSGLDQEIGRVLVHVDLANVGTLTLLLDDLDELLARLEVDGGIPAGSGGTVTERAGDRL